MALSPDYVAGFIDGEGCFELGVAVNSAKRKYGWQPRVRFSLAQNGDPIVLSELLTFFACGKVRPHHSKSSAAMHVFTIESRRDIITIAMAAFDTLPLIVKKHDFSLWREAALLLGPGRRHHTAAAYLAYLDLRDQINVGKGSRRKLDTEKLRQAIITKENS